MILPTNTRSFLILQITPIMDVVRNISIATFSMYMIFPTYLYVLGRISYRDTCLYDQEEITISVLNNAYRTLRIEGKV